MFAVSEAIITTRRGSRSATTPANASVETCASVHAANARPIAAAPPPTESTANDTAIGARFVPKKEIVRAEKTSRKFRSRSASTGGF